MSASVRLAQHGDIPILESLFLEFSGWPLQRSDSIQEAIKDPNGELLVAELEGQIVAFIHQIFFIDPLHGGLNSELTSLFVKKEHRRKGIASKLVQQSLKNAKRRNVVEVHVTTREDNIAAVRFYEANAFRREGLLFECNP
ncbi:MAG: GNAT family N-acetyltransferase [Candidatus Bathyarchaeota archaeon]|nr:MAG: GNAT family N-acetyltransferase [Candidatus Bathyarchaeota archaeon]